jgi:hypothetical protein
MGLFSWLFGGPPKSGVVPLAGTGEFDFPIVGEGPRQQALETLAGGRTEDGVEQYCAAVLRREPSNRFDSNAVRVEINRQHVGYLNRKNASEYCRRVRALGFSNSAIASCPAVIVGGWDRGDGDRGHFGVKLDLKWPVQERGRGSG